MKKQHKTGIISTNWSTAQQQAAFDAKVRELIWGKLKKC